MKVLVLGGYGMIGSAVVRRLIGEGFVVSGLGRRVDRARRTFPQARWLAADIARLRNAADWLPHLHDIDAVVDTAGALQDEPGSDLRDLQERAMQALWRACEIAGVKHVVQVSAVGAFAGADTAFLRTKAAADTALALTGLDWTVLRPGLVIGPRAYGGSALLRALAGFPWVMPILAPESRLQTVALSDVADAVLGSLRGTHPTRCVYDLVETDGHRLDEVVGAFRAWLGLPPAPTLRLPPWVAPFVASPMDALAWLGWRSPLRSTALAVLSKDVVGDPEPYRLATGRSLQPMHATLAALPVGPEDRWFSRLYLLKPLIFICLAFFWLVSGLVGFTHSSAAAAVLTSAGIPARFALSVTLAGSVADIVLGLLICHRRTARPALFGTLVVSFGYLIGATLIVPALWFDPLGPLVKVLPANLLSVVALAILEDR